MSLRVKVLACIGFLLAQASHAQGLSGEARSQALKDIRETADAICKDVPLQLQGNSSNLELSGQGKVQLDLLLKRLGAAGVVGAAKYTSSEFNNVLQKDLAPLLQKTQECKLRVFEKLSDLFIPPPKSTSLKPANLPALGNLDFTIDSVVRAGSDIVASFTIKNIGQNEERLTLFGKGSRYGYGGSTLIASGREFLAQSVNISGQESKEFLDRRFFPGAPLTGIVRFNNIPPDVKSIDVMRIAFSHTNLRPSGAFEFRAFTVE